MEHRNKLITRKQTLASSAKPLIQKEVTATSTQPATSDFNSLTEFTTEQKQNILNTFVEKYKVSEQVAIDNINKGLQENRQSTIEQLKKCY
jgi:hypothetical protein